jgi:hypothetical protein
MSETINPYQSPSESFEPGYYAFDFARARWREIWRHSKSREEFWRAASAKLLGQCSLSGVINLHPLLICTPGDLPASVVTRTEPLVAQWRQHGFHVNLAACRPSQIMPTQWNLYALSPDCRTIATMSCDDGESQWLVFGLGSRTQARRLITTSRSASLGMPPWVHTVTLPGAGFTEVWERHQARLSAEPSERFQVYTSESQRAAVIDHQSELGRYQLDLGLIVPLGEEEIASLRPKKERRAKSASQWA